MEYSVCESAFCRHRGDVDKQALQAFRGIVPHSYKYVVCSCTSHDTSNTQLTLVFRINIKSKQELMQWKQDFENSSCTTLRVLRTGPAEGERVLYKVWYRCQHNTLSKSSTADSRPGSKNTNCKAGALVSVYNTEMKKRSLTTSKDPHRQEYPTFVSMEFTHNHPINIADALKHRDVSDQTRQRLEELLLAGYRPAAALNLYKFDLQETDPDNYIFNSADRSICPDKQYVYRLYYKLFAEQYGNSRSSGEEISALKSFIESLNQMCTMQAASSRNPAESTSSNLGTSSDIAEVSTAANLGTRCQNEHQDVVKMEVTDDNQVIVAICTPMMQRVHQYIKHSGELVFCDASGNMDRHQCRVFVLLTHSVVGGLPLGILIVTSESKKTVQHALELYKSMLPSSAFYGRGTTGPELIMTDDSKAERQALSEVFPSSTLLLCAFHVLQAYWRFLWDSKNAIPKSERPHLFHLMKTMLYASTPQQLQECYDQALQDSTLQKHQNINKYLEALFGRRSEWSLCCRNDLPVRGNNTNNYCEAAIRVMKDQVLNRTKAFNVLQLVDFIFKRLDTYYQRRCIDVSNNRLQDFHPSKSKPTMSLQRPNITRCSATQFEVSSLTDPSKSYLVDMDAGFCTCHAGFTGGPCKHQEEIVKQYHMSSWNFMPTCDQVMRALLYKVATGKEIDLSWFQSLRSRPETEDLQSQSLAMNENLVTEDTASAEESIAVAEVDDFDSSDDFDLAGDDEKLLKDFNDMCEHMKTLFVKNRSEFRKPMQQMVRSSQKIKCNSHWASAMSCFGKYTGVSLAQGGKQKLVSNKDIGVQPAAKQRRVLAGCTGLRVGRPPTGAAAAARIKRDRPLSAVSLPRKKAKHSLKDCVEVNCSLGKTHAAK